MDISTPVQPFIDSPPIPAPIPNAQPSTLDAGLETRDVSTHAPAQVEWDIVSPPDHMAAISRPGETIGEMMLPTMQFGICFNSPKPAGAKNERKILVVLGKKY
jgi:hypothetical protein